MAMRQARYINKSMSPNLLKQDMNVVRQTGHSFMFGTGAFQGRNIELPQITSPRAPTTIQQEMSSVPVLEESEDPTFSARKAFEKERVIMDKVLKS